MRWGEATALTWADIDSAEQTRRVRRSHVRGAIRNTKKTGKRRIVLLFAKLAAVLADHRRRMVELQHGPPGQLGVRQRGGQAARQRLGLRREQGSAPTRGDHKHVTIHGLRRTASDLLRHAAVDPVTAKAIIGHTTDRVREHYSTINADEARGIGTRLGSLVPAIGATRGG